MTSILPDVASRLQREIKQTKPFGSLEEEVILNLARTNEYLGTRAAEVFKRADLTGTLITIFPVTNDTVFQTNLTLEYERFMKLETNTKVLPKEGTPVKLVIEVPEGK